MKASKRILENANVKIEKIDLKNKKIIIDFDEINLWIYFDGENDDDKIIKK